MIQEITTQFEGAFGNYQITIADQYEVRRYRIALLVCGISFFIGMSQWLTIGPEFVGLWILPILISLGLALKWIHIYISLLHKILQVLWAIGCLGFSFLMFKFGPEYMLIEVSRNSIFLVAIGPLFAALTGVGFKEFFCFRRAEAIGLTLLLPISLTGHLLKIMNGNLVLGLMFCSSILLLILSIRKFGMSPASDIGDKSVFDYLQSQKAIKPT